MATKEGEGMTEERDAHLDEGDSQAEEPVLGLVIDRLHQVELQEPEVEMRADLDWIRAHQVEAYATLMSAADALAADSEDYRRLAKLARGLRDVLERTEERLVHDLWSVELRHHVGQVREI